jgi:hypothetical protein
MARRSLSSVDALRSILDAVRSHSTGRRSPSPEQASAKLLGLPFLAPLFGQVQTRTGSPEVESADWSTANRGQSFAFDVAGPAVR